MQNRKLSVAKTAVEIEKQKLPTYVGVELSYAFEMNNPNGSKRTGFCQRSGKPVIAAVYVGQAGPLGASGTGFGRRRVIPGRINTSNFSPMWPMLLDMLTKRKISWRFYDEEILTRAAQQAEAALSAYQADTTEFAE